MESTSLLKTISLVTARKILLSRIPLSALPHEVVATQHSAVNDGLKRLHAGAYDEAIELLHAADGVQENNLVLFYLSFAYYLIGKYDAARVFADRIDTAHCGPGCMPKVSDVELLYFLVEVQAAGWEGQEDNYRLSGGPSILFMAPDLLQHSEYYLRFTKDSHHQTS